MRHKGFLQAVVILTVVGLVIVGTVGYFIFSKKPTAKFPTPTDFPRIVIGHVTDQVKCATQPKLTSDEVVAIAQKSKLSKQLNGWWEVTYSRGSSWRTNHCSDECIWAVRSHAPAPDGADFGSYALDVTYIRDPSGEFYYDQ